MTTTFNLLNNSAKKKKSLRTLTFAFDFGVAMINYYFYNYIKIKGGGTRFLAFFEIFQGNLTRVFDSTYSQKTRPNFFKSIFWHEGVKIRQSRG